MMRGCVFVTVWLGLAAVGCGDDGESASQPRPDVGLDVTADVVDDPRPDVSDDLPSDAATDGSGDVGDDGTTDTGDVSPDTDADTDVMEPMFTPCPSPRPDAWHVCEGQIYDPDGRIVLLRGVNVSQERKRSPYEGGMTDEDLALMRELGFNHIRLLTSWAAVMPQEGVIDQTYLDRLLDEIRRAATYDILVILDAHQDLYGEAIATENRVVGNGCPDWACPDEIAAEFTEARSPWFLNYAHPAVIGCFDNLYADTELQDQFAAAWGALAATVADEPNVVGYDLWNEPFFGSQNLNTWERDALLPLYERLAAAILAEDPGSLIVTEPGNNKNVFGTSFLPPPSYGNVVYEPHLYNAQMESGAPWNGDIAPFADRLDVDAQEALVLDAALYIGEWGAQGIHDNDPDFVRAVTALLDERQLSWASWQWGPGSSYAVVDDERTVSAHGFELARPYPARFAGSDMEFLFDPDTNTLTASWTATSEAETVFAIPSARYPDGADTTVIGGSIVDATPSRVVVRSGEPGSTVEVTIAPAE